MRRARHVAWLLVLLLFVAAATAHARSDRSAAGPRVVLVTDAGGCSGAATLRLCEGFKAALRKTGVRGRLLTVTFREDLSDTITLVARQRNDLTIVFGIVYEQGFGLAVKRAPDARFAVVDWSWQDVPHRPANVEGVVFRTSEAAYLAGWLAGKLEQRRPGPDVVGAVGGFKIPAVDDFIVGFAAGARVAAPGIRVLVGYSKDFADQAKCRAIARRQIAQGAGTVFNVAGACGLGTLDAAREAGVWGVGVDSDQSHLGPHILTSAIKRYDAGFLVLLQQVKTGRVVTGRDTVLTMRDGAVGLGPISPKVPAALRAGLDRLQRRVVAGEVRVPGTVPNPR